MSLVSNSIDLSAASEPILGVEATCLAKERSGIGRYTFELVATLENLEQNIKLYTLDQAENIPEIKGMRSKKHYLNNTFRKFIWVIFDFLNFLKIDWFLLSKPDFLIFPNFKYLRSNIPSLTIIHDIGYTKKDIWTAKGFNKKISRWGRLSTTSNTKIATVSQTIAYEISAYYNIAIEDILILKPGIASYMLNSKLEEEKARSGFLVVGTFEKRKNMTSIVRAFNNLEPEIQKQNPLTLVGRFGNDYNNIKILAEGNKYITLIKDITDTDLVFQYQKNAFLVSASNYEGYGMQVAEAMHFGLGLLLSDIEAHREVSGGFAEYFTPNDTLLLTQKLNLIKQTYPKTYKSAASSLASNYTWDVTARVLLDYISKDIK